MAGSAGIPRVNRAGVKRGVPRRAHPMAYWLLGRCLVLYLADPDASGPSTRAPGKHPRVRVEVLSPKIHLTHAEMLHGPGRHLPKSEVSARGTCQEKQKPRVAVPGHMASAHPSCPAALPLTMTLPYFPQTLWRSSSDVKGGFRAGTGGGVEASHVIPCLTGLVCLGRNGSEEGQAQDMLRRRSRRVRRIGTGGGSPR